RPRTGRVSIVAKDPEQRRLGLAEVAPAQHRGALGEQRLAAPQHRAAALEQDLDETADDGDELDALVAKVRGRLAARREGDQVGAQPGPAVVDEGEGAAVGAP